MKVHFKSKQHFSGNSLSLQYQMTLKQKYKSLQNADYVQQMITNSVYDTMQLEGQGIAYDKVKKLVNEVLQSQAPKLQSAQVLR